jgi:hypothetical protein
MDTISLPTRLVFRELHVRSYVYRLTAPEEQNPAALERPWTYILRASHGSGDDLQGACLLPSERENPRAVAPPHGLDLIENTLFP